MMRKITLLFSFLLGFLFCWFTFVFWKTEPYDVGVFRMPDYEIWIQGAASSPVVMATYRYEVKYRKLCSIGNQVPKNVCTDWRMVAAPHFDAPYRFEEIKLIETGTGGLTLQFPEGVVVETADKEKWSVRGKF